MLVRLIGLTDTNTARGVTCAACLVSLSSQISRQDSNKCIIPQVDADAFDIQIVKHELKVSIAEAATVVCKTKEM